jgi:uncharacterized damage-inducible protein DinB
MDPDREPLEVLARTPGVLARIAGEHAPERLRARPFEGRWTPNEILGHFGDAEWAYGWRTRVVLGEAKPVFTGFDQDGWVAAQRLNDREPAELVEMFSQLRSWNLEVWRRLTPRDLARTAEGRKGRVSLGELLITLARHDLHHLDQIARYLDALKVAG